VNPLVEGYPADDPDTTWVEALSDDELADQLDAVGAGQLTPPERAAVLAEAAERLRATEHEQSAAIPAAEEEDNIADVEPTFAGWVEF
jgi:acyl-CoA reductase-like NAD-dependent aldehyde dehydrogenase